MRWIIWEHTYVKYLVERIKTILLDQCINNEHLIAFLNRITICNTLMRIFVLKITENIQKIYAVWKKNKIKKKKKKSKSKSISIVRNEVNYLRTYVRKIFGRKD